MKIRYIKLQNRNTPLSLPSNDNLSSAPGALMASGGSSGGITNIPSGGTRGGCTGMALRFLRARLCVLDFLFTLQ